MQWFVFHVAVHSGVDLRPGKHQFGAKRKS
jgi:hypothetical protein